MPAQDTWATFARIHAQADSRVLSDRAWAIDDALDSILANIERGEAVSDQQAENLITNRTKKYRRHRRFDGMSAPALESTSADENARLEARCDIAKYEARCTTQEWGVLTEIGVGRTYRDVAASKRLPEGTVKTLARRGRLKLAA